MSIDHRRQSQFELFPGASGNSHGAEKTARLTKDLTLSMENIIVLSIVLVMAMVLFFSFGVEKGKRIASLSGATGDGDFDRAARDAVAEQSAGSVVQAPQEEKMVFPVAHPQEAAEENKPTFHPPLEKRDEQEKLFTIQVASFKLEENARREAERLKGIGHEDTFVVPKGSHTIVCVGKFAQMGEAKKFSSRLRNRYNDCLVRRL
jgi:cell division septation protein DedD